MSHQYFCCLAVFFIKYCGGLVDEILDDEWTPCEKVVD